MSTSVVAVLLSILLVLAVGFGVVAWAEQSVANGLRFILSFLAFVAAVGVPLFLFVYLAMVAIEGTWSVDWSSHG